MSEVRDYRRLRKKLLQQDDRIDRIENLVVDGMPDINYCSLGYECWIELKSPTEPKNIKTSLFGSNHKISQCQKNWMLRQIKARGRAYFMISTDKRWMLIGGAFADFINDMTVQNIIDNSIWCTTKPIKDKERWHQLREALTS